MNRELLDKIVLRLTAADGNRSFEDYKKFFKTYNPSIDAILDSCINTMLFDLNKSISDVTVAEALVFFSNLPAINE